MTTIPSNRKSRPRVITCLWDESLGDDDDHCVKWDDLCASEFVAQSESDLEGSPAETQPHDFIAILF